MYFGDWVLKLLNCIAWRLNSGVGPLTAAAPPSLSYLLDPDLSEKWFFEKPSSGPLVINKKKSIKIFDNLINDIIKQNKRVKKSSKKT